MPRVTLALAEKTAIEYSKLCGKLAAAVEWCVNNSGECLADNPKALAYVKEVLAEAQAKYDAVT